MDHSGRAWYRQIADDLRSLIVLGELLPGDKLPSESELTQYYGVARMTVRQAVQILRYEGLVVSIQGSGVFVRGNAQKPPNPGGSQD